MKLFEIWSAGLWLCLGQHAMCWLLSSQASGVDLTPFRFIPFVNNMSKIQYRQRRWSVRLRVNRLCVETTDVSGACDSAKLTERLSYYRLRAGDVRRGNLPPACCTLICPRRSAVGLEPPLVFFFLLRHIYSDIQSLCSSFFQEMRAKKKSNFASPADLTAAHFSH